MKKEILYALIAVALLLLLLAYFRSGSSDRLMESGRPPAPAYQRLERRDAAPAETPGRPAATPGRSAE